MFPYKSRAYAILYYGASRRRSFKTSQIKECLSGCFPQKDHNRDFLEPARKLQKAGFLLKVDKDTWRVTNAGIKAMISSAAYYRESRVRTLGPTYLDKAYEKIRVINSSTMDLMKKLDAEDAVLVQIEDEIARRNKVKSYSKISSR